MGRKKGPGSPEGPGTLSFLLNSGLDEVDPGENLKVLENDRDLCRMVPAAILDCGVTGKEACAIQAPGLRDHLR